MMLDAIKGIDSVVPVTSLRAYITLSSGVKFLVWETTAKPVSSTCFINFSSDKATLKPGMLSSLSIVPPVIPNPLPLILAIFMPNDAHIGPIIIVVVSPIPPVECLSTKFSIFSPKWSSSPLFKNISVKARVSVKFIPLITIAIKRALIW